MKYYLDRIEEGIAVCYAENRVDKLEIPFDTLPGNAEIGDTLVVNADGTLAVDKADSTARSERIADLMEDLFS